MRRSLLILFGLLALAGSAASVSPPASAASERVENASARSARQARAAVRARLVRRVAGYARRQLGTPYRWGGASPGGFDCSGLVYAAYRSVGRSIPRTTWGQLQTGRRVSWRRLRAGDLLFTDRGGHVFLVVSRSAAIDSPRSGRRVRVVPLSALRGRFHGARRLI